MKRIIMTLAVTLSSLFAFASDENISNDVLSAFNKEFNGAKEVKWTSGTDFYKASFIFNDQYISAFYNREGVLTALTRNISVVTLPLALQTKIRAEYGEYWISDLFEMSSSEGTNYYITLEKADTKLVLKSSDTTAWTLFRKTSKQ